IIDGVPSPGVSKVTGLSEGEIDTIEQPDGGTNHVYKIAASKVKFEPLTVERYVDGSPEDKRFRDWFQQVFKLDAKSQGGSGVRAAPYRRAAQDDRPGGGDPRRPQVPAQRRQARHRAAAQLHGAPGHRAAQRPWPGHSPDLC